MLSTPLPLRVACALSPSPLAGRIPQHELQTLLHSRPSDLLLTCRPVHQRSPRTVGHAGAALLWALRENTAARMEASTITAPPAQDRVPMFSLDPSVADAMSADQMGVSE